MGLDGCNGVIGWYVDDVHVYECLFNDHDSDNICNDIDNCPETPNPNQEDLDGDEIGDVCDNCPNIPNGPDGGTCVDCNDGSVGSSCTDNEQCSGGYCSMNQEDYDGDNAGDVCDGDIAEDSYPPGGNDCIDACECEGDVHGTEGGAGYPDGDVDGSDAFEFKQDFGRWDCVASPPCYRDHECDGDVDGSDAFKFKTDFGRSDCPPCTFTCSY
jgi:hypothetical protein